MRTLTRISIIGIILGVMSACGSQPASSSLSSSSQPLKLEITGEWYLVEMNGFALDAEEQMELVVVFSFEQIEGCPPAVVALLEDTELTAVTQSLNSCFVHYDANSSELSLSQDLTEVSYFDLDAEGDLVVESASGTRYVFSR